MARADGIGPIAGVVLAGGRARRMGGGDKALLPLAGRPLIAHVLARATPQVAALLINANADPAAFAGFGLPVAADRVAGFAGPLAGILTAVRWAPTALPGARFVASFATDTPFLPRDLVARLAAALTETAAAIALAASRGRRHPVFGLWPLALADDLERAVCAEGVRRIEDWTARHRVAIAAFDDDAAGCDPFFNINAPADLDAAAAVLARPGAGMI